MHQLIDSFSHYFCWVLLHPRWFSCRISEPLTVVLGINSSMAAYSCSFLFLPPLDHFIVGQAEAIQSLDICDFIWEFDCPIFSRGWYIDVYEICWSKLQVPEIQVSWGVSTTNYGPKFCWAFCWVPIFWRYRDTLKVSFACRASGSCDCTKDSQLVSGQRLLMLISYGMLCRKISRPRYFPPDFDLKTKKLEDVLEETSSQRHGLIFMDP